MLMHALTSLGPRFSRALFLALICLSFASARAVASEIIVQNDSIPPTGVNYLANEVGERLAVRLTSPVSGHIVGVQLFWGSDDGGAAPSQEAAIRISAADGELFNSTSIGMPGTVLATIASPVLTDGGSSEFRYLDPTTNLLPLSVPISAGEDFYVDLGVAQIYPNAPDSPGLFFDADVPADLLRSLIHVPSAGGSVTWVPPALFISGEMDWGIRAIIQPVPELSSYAPAAIGAIALLAVRRKNLD
jgi:hypothetical protein